MGHADLNVHWVGAGHLEIGDKIRKADGSSGIVLAVVNVVQARVMFNLEVQDNHDFFVGGSSWLVHNAGFSGGCPVLTDDPYNPNSVLGRSQKTQYLVESLRNTGKLPGEYVDKTTAEAAGWGSGKAINNHIPGALIGGDVYRNLPPLLPSDSGRIWYEADIGSVSHMTRAKQPGTRLLYSNDGLLYVTADHYKTFGYIGTWK